MGRGGGHGGGGFGPGRGFGRGSGRPRGGWGWGGGWGGWWPWYLDDLDDVEARYAPAFGQDSTLSGPTTDPATTTAFLAQLATAAASIHDPLSITSFQSAYNAALGMGEVTGPVLPVSGSLDALTAGVVQGFMAARSPSVSGEGLPSVDGRTRAALAELGTKRLDDIQRETALTWAYRARAAGLFMRRAQAQGLHALAHRWLRDATEYAHEAVEHAALCGDGRVLWAVRRLTSSIL